MTELLVYSIIGIIFFIFFFQSHGLKKGLLELPSMFALAFFGLLIERIIDKQFDLITLIIFLSVILLFFLSRWLRKRTKKNIGKKKKILKKRKK